MKKTTLLLTLICFFGLAAILTTLFLRAEAKQTQTQEVFYFPQYPENGTFWEVQVELGFIND